MTVTLKALGLAQP